MTRQPALPSGLTRPPSCQSSILVPWGLSIAATSTMTSVEPGVLDANVLAYAPNADAAQHVAARTLLEAALDPSKTLYVTSQILCESYSGGGDRRGGRFTGFSPADWRRGR